MQGGETGVGLGNERAVDGFGNVVAVEGVGQGAGVLAGAGIEPVGLHLRKQGDAEGPFILTHLFPEGVEDSLPVGAVGDRAPPGVAGLVEVGLTAVRQLDRRPGQVGVGEDAIERTRRPRHQPGGRQNALGLGAQRVGRGPHRFHQVELVPGQTRLGGDETLDFGCTDREQLGIHVTRGLGKFRPQQADLLGALEHRGLPGVLVQVERGIHAQTREFVAHALQVVHRRQKRGGAFAEPALILFQLGNLGRQLVLGGAPGGLVGVEQGQVPDVGGSRRGLGHFGGSGGGQEGGED